MPEEELARNEFLLPKGDEQNIISFLKRLLSNTNDTCIDFSSQPFLIPFATLSLLIWIRNQLNNQKKVYARNYKKFTYLNRMDFFRQCNLPVDENFSRHPPAGRFLPITQIRSTDSDKQASFVADFFVPEQIDSDDPEKTGIYDYICYAFSELINNVIQHSHGNGFYFAQKYESLNVLRFAVADDGIGIRESLKDTPYIRDTHLESIQEAIKPRISGRAWRFTSESPNAGVGLSTLIEIAKITKGDYFIFSGNGLCSSRGNWTLDNEIKGTVCGFTFPLSVLDQQGFNTVLHPAKINLKLLDDVDSSRFDEVFL